MLPQPTIPTALDPLLGVGPSPHEPRDVDLPGERAVSRSFEDEFERRLAPVLWFEFPMVVVVAEPNPLALKALGNSPEFLAERTPAFARHVALLGGTAGMKRAVRPKVRQASSTASGFSRKAAMLTWPDGALRPRKS